MSANRIEQFLSKFGSGIEQTIQEATELIDRREEIEKLLKEKEEEQ